VLARDADVRAVIEGRGSRIMTDSFRPASKNAAARHVLGVAIALALLLPCCMTHMQPAVCGDEKSSCGHLHDVRFCENVALSVDGSDCASAKLMVGKPFCYVSSGPCVQRTFALKDHDCVVYRYQLVRESEECSQGTPTFGP
jgi:hypothetical protein